MKSSPGISYLSYTWHLQKLIEPLAHTYSYDGVTDATSCWESGLFVTHLSCIRESHSQSIVSSVVSMFGRWRRWSESATICLLTSRGDEKCSVGVSKESDCLGVSVVVLSSLIRKNWHAWQSTGKTLEKKDGSKSSGNSRKQMHLFLFEDSSISFYCNIVLQWWMNLLRLLLSREQFVSITDLFSHLLLLMTCKSCSSPSTTSHASSFGETVCLMTLLSTILS
jgi:hypothetical protein